MHDLIYIMAYENVQFPTPLKTTAGLYKEISFSAALPISLTLQYIHKTTALAWGMEHKLIALLGIGKERCNPPKSKSLSDLAVGSTGTHRLFPRSCTTPVKEEFSAERPERGSKRYCAPVTVLSLGYAFWLNVIKYLGLSSPSELPRKNYSFFLPSVWPPRILNIFFYYIFLSLKIHATGMFTTF